MTPVRESVATVNPPTWIGEALRWYLTRARHPFKNYIVGHYWGAFCAPRIWVRYDDSAAISVRLGDFLQSHIFFEGYYERPLVDWLKQTLRPDDVFWDVGANIGAVALVAAGLCGRVVAFEPDPPTVELLRQHAHANAARPIDIRPYALGARGEWTTLFQSSAGNTGRNSIVEGWATPAGTARVQVRRADDVVADDPALGPTVMKLDVEGAEAQVLSGCRNLLRSGRLRAVVFEDSMVDGAPATRAIVESLHDAGYMIRRLGPSVDATAPTDAIDVELFNFVATPEGRA